MDDVNLDGYEDYDFRADGIFKEFMFRSARDLNQVIKHLEAHGFEFSSRTLGEIVEALSAIKGRECVGYVKPRVYTARDGSPKEQNQLTAVSPLAD
jgi:hypothetical protein